MPLLVAIGMMTGGPNRTESGGSLTGHQRSDHAARPARRMGRRPEGRLADERVLVDAAAPGCTKLKDRLDVAGGMHELELGGGGGRRRAALEIEVRAVNRGFDRDQSCGVVRMLGRQCARVMRLTVGVV